MGSRRNRAAPSGGFAAGGDDDDSSSSDDSSEFEFDPDDDLDAGCNQREIDAYLRRRYANKATEVLSVLAMWQAYGELYASWNDPWESTSEDYRAKRALRAARAGARPAPPPPRSAGDELPPALVSTRAPRADWR